MKGIGVMLSEMGGNRDSASAFQAAVGKTLTALEMSEDALRLTFEDGSKIRLYDDGQSCCEHRYMTTDDGLGYFVGAQLLDAEVQDGPDQDAEYDVHEVQFLKVKTSKGVFTVETHNKHNGYYGGFSLRCEVEEPA